MCDFGYCIWEDAKENQARESALRFSEMGLSPEDIAKGVGVDIDIVQKWISESVPEL